jgi:hypothetical protein
MTTISFGFIMPLLTAVGVMRMRSGPSRTEMLPSVDAT